VDRTWRAEWEAALDDLELSVEVAEQLLGGVDVPLPAWAPPRLGGPLPAELLPRAQDLFRRQQEAIVQVTAASTSTRQQIELTRRMRESTANHPPVYLDVTA